jgi:hypothetical protein
MSSSAVVVYIGAGTPAAGVGTFAVTREFVLMALIGFGGLLLSAAGFGITGVAGGSIAAWIQSATGNVGAGSLFAGLQSFGATGGFVSMIFTGLNGFLDWLFS